MTSGKNAQVGCRTRGGAPVRLPCPQAAQAVPRVRGACRMQRPACCLEHRWGAPARLCCRCCRASLAPLTPPPALRPASLAYFPGPQAPHGRRGQGVCHAQVGGRQGRLFCPAASGACPQLRACLATAGSCSLCHPHPPVSPPPSCSKPNFTLVRQGRAQVLTDAWLGGGLWRCVCTVHETGQATSGTSLVRRIRTLCATPPPSRSPGSASSSSPASRPALVGAGLGGGHRGSFVWCSRGMNGRTRAQTLLRAATPCAACSCERMHVHAMPLRLALTGVRLPPRAPASLPAAVVTEGGQRWLLTNAHSVSYGTQARGKGKGTGGGAGLLRMRDGFSCSCLQLSSAHPSPERPSPPACTLRLPLLQPSQPPKRPPPLPPCCLQVQLKKRGDDEKYQVRVRRGSRRVSPSRFACPRGMHSMQQCAARQATQPSSAFALLRQARVLAVGTECDVALLTGGAGGRAGRRSAPPQPPRGPSRHAAPHSARRFSSYAVGPPLPAT